MKLTIISAPYIDREKLRVRINKNDKPDNIDWYDFVQLKLRANGKTITCKLHGDDIPEIEEKGKQPSLIRMNEPLRGQLGVELGRTLDFDIKKARKCLTWYYFVRYHPDDIVKVSIRLAIIAVIISIIAILISIIH